MLRWMLRCLLAVVTLGFSFTQPEDARGQDSGYQLPPQEVVDIITARPAPSISLSPNAEWMLVIERPAMPGIEDVSRRMLQLAGMRIDPAANGPFQTSFNEGLLLRARDAKDSLRIPLPENAKLGGTSWCHDSQKFVFTLVTPKGQQLWFASVDSPQEPRMLTDRLSTVTGGFSWMPDTEHVLCKVVPKDRGDEPAVQ